ncbi:MAG: ribbon-helix-helix domain-containing protein [Candidatus Scalindua sp.]|nr:ribbon-helix-helix domain-containing protein [Candidatus Scalindua sp.]
MDTVRLNVTLPKELVRQLDKLVGSRKKSHFIAEALKQKIKKIQNEELQKLLKEGYKATKQESLGIAKEFEPNDLEGWDEY